MKRCISALTLLSLAGPAFAANYPHSETIVGPAFYDAFEFQAIGDPTHGRVNYVDRATAQNANLTYAAGDTFILRADFKKTLNPTGPGRDSVRIRSKKVYTNHVAIFNVRHMPQGCGTWPAIWETNEASWPNGGEVDIIEGVNDQAPSAVTLHTGSGCVMPASRPQTGTSTQLDCDAALNGNTGCGVTLNTGLSYGPAFNANQGGWYVVERTPSFIKVWFWSRNDASVPSDVRDGRAAVNTGSWGTPSAFFPNDSCDMQQHFNEHNIIINLTFCGDWAGSVYPATCPSTCVDFVNNNPSQFENAFFDIASVRVYS